MRNPMLIIVTGRPGAGKTTLAERLSREWYLPLVSRDRIKEGYVHTTGKSHDQLPEGGNGEATNAFFETLEFLLDRGISCIAEAAFQHRLWSARLEQLKDKADIHILICHVDAQMALDRFLERGLNDPARISFHGDKGVHMFRQGIMPKPGPYDEPKLGLPTYRVDTSDGYQPSLDELKSVILNRR